jgi:ABC-type Fe3+/spermidine/putrescine transport system ATPase subunit
MALTPAVEAHDVAVSYGTTPALRSVDLTVAPGETVALLGPSGSGKTTLLYALAGFLPLAGGRIELCGSEVGTPDRTVPPERRPVAMVFQHYGLWPHLDALDTVAYPLRRSGLGADEARGRARELLGQLRIQPLAGRRPAELSGGEQQRVGLARALARRPQVYLLDEPTAHLDAELKRDLQSELRARIHADDAAAVHATHDVDEALAVADRLVLLRAGEVVQVGTPVEVYERPVDDWAATLTGPASFVDGWHGSPEDGRFLVRPDWVRLDGQDGPIAATVGEVLYRGTHTDYRLATAMGSVFVRELGPPRLGAGAATTCRVERAWRMPEPPMPEPRVPEPRR